MSTKILLQEPTSTNATQWCFYYQWFTFESSLHMLHLLPFLLFHEDLVNFKLCVLHFLISNLLYSRSLTHSLYSIALSEV